MELVHTLTVASVVTIPSAYVPVAVRFLATEHGPSAQPIDSAAGNTDLNRRVLTLVGAFRLLVAAAILLAAVFQPDPPFLGSRYPLLLIATGCAYALAAVIIALILRRLAATCCRHLLHKPRRARQRRNRNRHRVAAGGVRVSQRYDFAST
jgi:hypothetical protein